MYSGGMSDRENRLEYRIRLKWRVAIEQRGAMQP
jgi:hypothetical protein